MLVSCNMFTCQNSQKQNMVLLKLDYLFVEASSYLGPFIKDGYQLTVTEIKEKRACAMCGKLLVASDS